MDAEIPGQQHCIQEVCHRICGSCEQGELQPGQRPECLCWYVRLCLSTRTVMELPCLSQVDR